MIARVLAVAVGAVILAAVMHVTVLATGGYGTPHSYVTIAVTVGLGFASVFVSMAWDADRRRLAVLFVITIIAGEAFNLIATAERLIKAREAEQAPLRAGQEAYDKAAKRVADADAAVKSLPSTSKRLQDATAAKTAADKAVVEKSAERGCREHCRHLLQKAVDDAVSEVKAARAEIQESKAGATVTLEKAKVALSAMKPPESPTPLADRLGVPAWIIDLLTSALGSIAANGLACCLLIFGAHHVARRVEIVSPISPIGNPSPKRKPATVKDHAARFALECLQPGGEAELDAIGRRYGSWRSPADRFSKLQVRQAVADLFEEAGIQVVERGEQIIAVGVSLKQPENSMKRLT
jgi:hypothetical protein